MSRVSACGITSYAVDSGDPTQPAATRPPRAFVDWQITCTVGAYGAGGVPNVTCSIGSAAPSPAVCRAASLMAPCHQCHAGGHAAGAGRDALHPYAESSPASSPWVAAAVPGSISWTRMASRLSGNTSPGRAQQHAQRGARFAPDDTKAALQVIHPSIRPARRSVRPLEFQFPSASSSAQVANGQARWP